MSKNIPTLYKKKGVGELPLFRSLCVFNMFLTPLVINMDKDIKVTFGYNIIKSLIYSIKLLRKSYTEKDLYKKLEYIEELYGEINDIELFTKMLFEMKRISLKQQSNISIHFGDILMQLNGWKASVESNINNKSNTNKNNLNI